jgi:23S rRNA (cytosine1962-C5)-methyltransferase
MRRSGSPPRLRLRVTAAAEPHLRQGHPWLFADSIREQNRPGELGELAVVYDRQDRFLAIGLFDPDSPIRLRVLHRGKPATLDDAWWAAHLDRALQVRSAFDETQTTGWRWIYGESDGWPGLVLDRYNRTLVLKLYTAAWLPCLEQILALLRKRLEPERIILRLSRNIQTVARDRFSQADGQILLGGPLAGPVIFLENGLQFEADVLHGQKTGFFLDQRDNRRRVEALAADKRVLNAFSFSGGFSVYAARGGAQAVTDLDLSAHALAAAQRNFALNETVPSIRACQHELVQAEAFEWLSGNAGARFDLIVLDPPSLAKREEERAGAVRAYGKLVSSSLGHLARGGALVACSCSAHVTSREFFDAVLRAVEQAGRKFDELERTGHPADHPVGFAEAAYLKGIFLRERR